MEHLQVGLAPLVLSGSGAIGQEEVGVCSMGPIWVLEGVSILFI